MKSWCFLRVALFIGLSYSIASSRLYGGLSKPEFPVILIHGITGSAGETWGEFTDFLVHEGWQFGGSPVYKPTSQQVSAISSGDFYAMNMSDYNSLPFSSQNLTFSEQGWEIAAVVTKVLAANPGKTKVILVAHSMGGLAARSYLQGLAKRDGGSVSYRRDVASLITICTPHLGSEPVTVAQEPSARGLLVRNLVGLKRDGVAVRELSPGSAALLALNNLTANPLPTDVPLVSIVGTGIKLWFFPNLTGDGIVSAVSQSLANVPGTKALNHQAKELFVLPRPGCDKVAGLSAEALALLDVGPTDYGIGHTCATSDGGVWAELIRQFRSASATTGGGQTVNPSTGSVDASFSPLANLSGNVLTGTRVYAVAVQTDGKVVIGGAFTSILGASRNYIARLNADGSLDASFNPGSGANSTVYAMLIQPDGKIVIGGQFTTFNGASRARIARLNSDGSLDGTFNPGIGVNTTVYALGRQSDGKLMIGGAITSFGGAEPLILRLNSNGALDSSFDFGKSNFLGLAGGTIYALALAANGQVIVGGDFTMFDSNIALHQRVIRLNSNGTLDTQFLNKGSNPNAREPNSDVNAVAVQADGRIIIAGGFSLFDTLYQAGIARLTSDGSFDTTFRPGLGVGGGAVMSLAVQPDGKICIGGDFTAVSSSVRYGLARLLSDGTVDTTFVPALRPGSTVEAIAVVPGGLVIGGDFSLPNGRAFTARILTAAQDPMIAIQPESRTVITGGNVVFSVSASGTAPLTFQWRRNGVNLPGATDPTLLLAGVTIAQAGNYTVVVNNSKGSVSSTGAMLTVVTAENLPNLYPYGPPDWSDKLVISVKPGSHDDDRVFYDTDTLYLDWAVLNESLNSIAAGGFTTRLYIDGALKQSWSRSSMLSAGFYTYIEDFSLGRLAAGTHTIRIETDAFGEIFESDETDNSYTKTIAVSSPNDVVLLGQPFNQIVSAGNSAYFSVWVLRPDFSKPDPHTYQWQQNGVNIGGATNSDFFIPSVALEQAGDYSVVVRNATRALTSKTARLEVVPTNYFDQWEWRNPLPQGDLLFGVAYGSPGFVAVGALGTVLSSTDGVRWNKRTSGIKDNLRDVAFGNGMFVAIGSTPVVLTSTDGLGWTKRESNAQGASLLGIAFGGDRFVAVGGSDGMINAGRTSSAIVTSDDGIRWTPRNSGTTNLLSGVAYGNNTFVAVGDSQTILTSPDALSWTRRVLTNEIYSPSIAFGNGRFVIIGSGDTILTSTNGLNWIGSKLSENPYLEKVAYGAGSFVAVGNRGAVFISANGISWTKQAPPTDKALYGLAYGGGSFLAVGEGGVILSSSTAMTWSSRLTGTTKPITDIAYGNGTFMAVSGAGARLTSTNGIDWLDRSAIVNERGYDAVAFGNGMFVVASGGNFLTSTNGVALTQRFSDSTFSGISDIAFGQNQFVAVTLGSFILTSPNAVTWTKRPLASSYYLRAVTFGRDLFLAVGDDGVILSSADGITWTKRNAGSPQFHLMSVAYGRGIFVAVGTGGNDGLGVPILTSRDGASWTRVEAQGIPPLNDIVFGETGFVAVGSGVMLTSDDGIRWVRRKPSTYWASLYSVAYGGGAFVAVGENGTILQTGANLMQPAPSIGLQPQSQTVASGGNITLNITVTGSPPLTFQWRKDGVNLAGATNSSYVIVNAQTRDSGKYTVSISNGGGTVVSGDATVLVTPPPLRIKGDFNYDGKPEVLFQDANGFLAAWFMSGVNVSSGGYLQPNNVGDLGYRVAGVGDFDQDGNEDIVFQHSDGTLAVWHMNGAVLARANYLDPRNPPDKNWRVAGIADINNDGKPDLILQHVDGRLAVWYMNGVKLDAGEFFNPVTPGDAKWRVVGVADFNGDTRPDLVFQHQDGTLALWTLNGAKSTQAIVFDPSNPGASWRAVSVADRNGDGKPDILFQHTNLDLAIWFMDGTKLSSAAYLGTRNPGGTWKVVGP